MADRLLCSIQGNSTSGRTDINVTRSNPDSAWIEQPNIPALAESYVEDSILARQKSLAALAAWDRVVEAHRACHASIVSDPHSDALYVQANVEWFRLLYDACGYIEGSHGPDCIAFGL